VTRLACWVVTDGTAAAFGRVLSAHRSRVAAERRARSVGGVVESAQVAALVQAGLSSSEAVQCCAGLERRAVRVEVRP
jgi:hypothetical protein